MGWLFPNKRERLRRQAARWLARLLGEHDEADLAAFRRWHDADPSRADAFARVSAGYEMAEVLQRSERFGQAPARARPILTWPARYALAAGIAALLVVSAVVVLDNSPTDPGRDASVLVFATRIGEIRTVALPDGTRVTLDTASSVRVELLGEVRQVKLERGRARFEVAGDDTRPFVVEAGSHRIAGAARFDVAIDDTGAAVVRALEGGVAVDPHEQIPGAGRMRLGPGEAIRILRNGEPAALDRGAAEGVLWPTGRLEFDNVPLGKVLAEANRYARSPVVLADADLSDLRITGTFRAGDTEGLARAVAAALGLQVEVAPGGRIVLHPRRD